MAKRVAAGAWTAPRAAVAASSWSSMTRSLFISLSASELGKSTAFHKAPGFQQSPQPSSEDGFAMVWSGGMPAQCKDPAFASATWPWQRGRRRNRCSRVIGQA